MQQLKNSNPEGFLQVTQGQKQKSPSHMQLTARVVGLCVGSYASVGSPLPSTTTYRLDVEQLQG